MVFTSPHYKQKVAFSPVTAISKTPTSHRFKVGGIGRKELDKRFVGPCCGGERKVGDFNQSKCICCPKGKEFLAYCCQRCRLPLALNTELLARCQQQGGLQEVRLDAAMIKMIEKVEKELKEAQRSAGAAGPAAA